PGGWRAADRRDDRHRYAAGRPGLGTSRARCAGPVAAVAGRDRRAAVPGHRRWTAVRHPLRRGTPAAGIDRQACLEPAGQPARPGTGGAGAGPRGRARGAAGRTTEPVTTRYLSAQGWTGRTGWRRQAVSGSGGVKADLDVMQGVAKKMASDYEQLQQTITTLQNEAETHSA